MIAPSVTSLEISYWFAPDDAVGWLLRGEADHGQASTVSIAKIPVNDEHPTYALFPTLRRLTQRADMTFDNWKDLALGCPRLQQIDFTVTGIGGDGLEGASVVFPALVSLTFKSELSDGENLRTSLHMCSLHSEMPVLRDLGLFLNKLCQEVRSDIGQRLSEMKALEC